jgi:NAD(P)-dependent dehydrogenase (short-subunit alcohol dehydrogenase family)
MSERVAVITGGEGELAQAIAALLRAQCMTVQAPGRTELDVSKPDAIRDFFAGLERVDLLINNAGSREDSTLVKMSESQWDRVLEVNLRGAFLCAQAVSLKMIAQRSGHIVNVGSFSGKFGNFGQANYAAAKAGLIGLTQSLAREMGKRGVRVNCVLPGFLETKFTAAMTSKQKARILEMHELRRFNTAKEAARFIVFLDSMPFVSGQVFQLDSRVGSWT